jgi:hypothetical protein
MWKLLLGFILSGYFQSNASSVNEAFNTGLFYKVIASRDTLKINEQLGLVEYLNSNTKNAYKGALLMKKSAFLKSSKDKTTLFKQGRELLELAIKKENKNSEFRFLRLTIQENCPPVLKYNSNKNEDAEYVKQAFINFPHELQQAVLEYAKTSKMLKPSDFSK